MNLVQVYGNRISRHKRGAICLLVLYAFLFFSASASFAQETLRRSYLITHGSKSEHSSWQLQPGASPILTTDHKGERCISVFGPGRESMSLQVKNKDTDLTVRRVKDTITLCGILSGEKIDTCYSVDSAPWYQVMSYCLQDFVLDDRKNMEFWMLHPETYSPYKMRVVKKGIENISVCGQRIKTVRTRLRIKGALSLLWHGDAWYRASDGVLMKYRGQGSPPDFTETIVLYGCGSSPSD